MTSELELAQAIDQTNLDPTTTLEDARAFFEQAAQYRFAAVAILPMYVDLAASVLRGTDTRVDVAVSYPLSAVPGALKAAETADAVGRGADEIDYVMNVGLLKTGGYRELVDEAREVVAAADGRVVKAIIEMWGLTEAETHAACEICCEAAVDFVKSSSGFKGYKALRPSTLEDARLLLGLVGDRAQVKMAGGIRDTDFALQLLDLGIARLGTSSGVAIVEGLREQASSG
jgi:deoxyribose-phosphate aldolase